jgi:cytochrome P450
MDGLNNAPNETLLATALAIATTALLLRWVFGGSRKQGMMNIPGNNNGQWPILGDTLRLLNPRTMASYQVFCRQLYSSPVWRTSVLFKKCVFVSGNAHLKQLASEEKSKRNTQACFPPHHKALFGKYSILVTSGEEHGKVRKVIAPVLQPQLYKKEIDMAAAAFVEDCLRHCESKDCITLVPMFKQFTLRVALRIVLGNERWQDLVADAQSSKHLNSLLADFSIWSNGLLSAPTAMIPFTLAYKAMRARERIKRQLLNVIEEEKAALKLEKSQAADATSSTSNGSLIRLLLKECRKEHAMITDDVIIDNIFTLIFAGTDTTASILSSAFYELGKNPPLRQRLQSCVSSSNNDASYNEIILAFITEVQRLYPSAPFTMREVVTEGINLGHDIGTVPPGWLVTYSIAGTLLDDESSYPNPQLFDLDRWLIKDDTKLTSKPPIWAFGGGTRICPGKFLANAECLALLRLVLSRNDGFGWELQGEQNLEFQYTPGFFPIDGLRVKFFKKG